MKPFLPKRVVTTDRADEAPACAARMGPLATPGLRAAQARSTEDGKAELIE